MDAIVDAARSEGHDISEEQLRELVSLVFRSVARTVEQGASVTIPHLGTFKPSRREGREGIHPTDEGQEIEIPPAIEVTFDPAEKLEEGLEEE